MQELKQFKVTAYTGLYEFRQDGNPRFAEAATPEGAAMRVLGERLIHFGQVKDLRAKVSLESVHGGLKTVLLYRPPSWFSGL